MSAIRLSFLFSFAEKYTLMLLTVVNGMVLSRVLTPAQIGVFSIGAVLAGLAQVLRDFGVGQYLIQEKELTRAKLRAALGTSLISAWLLALTVLAASGALARYYAAPELQAVLQLLSLNFVLVPFTAITLPCLRRQLRFRAIYVINATHSAVQLSCSIWLALLGMGSLSLAWGTLAGTLAALLASICLRPPEVPWLPSVKGIGQVLHFGGYAAGGGIIDEIGVAGPDLIVGKVIGIEGAGIFGKAQGVINVFNQLFTSAVSPVIFPLFAAQARAGDDLRRSYLKTVSCITALAWPFFTFLGLLAGPIVRLLYGDQWDAAVPLIRVICGAAAVNSMFSMARYLFVATGQVKAQARLDALTVPVRLGAVLLAAPFGLSWVAGAIVAGALFRAWRIWRCLAQLSGLQPGQLLRAVRSSALLAGLTALAPLALLLGMGPDARPYWVLPLAGAGALALWLAGVLLLRHELGAELDLWRRKLLRLADVK